MISVDIEVNECTDFKKLGPGYHRKDATIMCIGMYDGSNFRVYEPGEQELIDRLASDEEKVFHNSVYDVGWLEFGYGYKVNGIIHDTMTREALIDEHADSFDLDSCCKRRGVQGKNYEDTLDAWFDEYKKLYGLKGDVWQNADVVWMTPSGKDAMIRYNKQDCIATYNLFMAQKPLFRMHEEAYQLECDLQPVIKLLNGNGFPVDELARDSFTELIKGKLKETEEILLYEYQMTPDMISSPKKLTVAMNNLGIYAPRVTKTGAQSWGAESLGEIEHPVIEQIFNLKKYTTLINNFLEGSLQRLVNGKAYSVFSPNKRDEGGTRTGRFGSRTINLQQIPAREESAQGIYSYGPEMRDLFRPLEGHLLGAWDYSSIEMYGFAHFATGPRAEIFKEQAKKGADFHTMAQELAQLEERIWAKRLNFTVLYGAGPKGIFLKNKSAFKTLEKTKEVYDKFHKGMPYIRTTQKWAENITKQCGYIKSIGGRVHHKPKPFFDAERGMWNDGMYKMLNYLIQGSCADTLKKGLVDAYKAGLFNVLTLHATVHDENVLSIPFNKEGMEAAQEFQRAMENAFSDRWTVPIRTGADIGPSWGKDIENFDFNNFEKYREFVK